MQNSLYNVVAPMSKKWMVNFILGLLFVSLGTWIFMTPLEGLVSFTGFFGLALIIAGLFEIAGTLIYENSTKYWGWHLINGTVDISIGILLILESSTAMELALYILAVWLFYKGLVALDLSWNVKSWNHRRWGWMFVLGCWTLIFSLLTMAFPIIGGLHNFYTIALGFLGLGTFNILVAYYLNKVQKKAKAVQITR
ncbi:MAG: DUF308 domain-containing protein [Arenibacter troitsensis]|nr:DUF308 domain-containing protein [Arenibacter troitsensis]